MRIRTLWAIAAIGVLGLAACGNDDSSDDSIEVVSDAKFDAGTTMARISKAGSVKVGTKFDQPGFGFADKKGKPQGFDVEIAKVIAGQLGIPASKIQWVESP